MLGFRRWRTAAAIAILVSAVACSGQSCSCVAPIKGRFPVAERHESAIQVRATSGLFTYLEANAQTVLNALLPGMGTFNVPPSCGTNKVCCATPAPMCRIDIKPQKLVLAPTPPNALHLVLTTQLISLDQLPVEFDTGLLGTAKCFVSIDTTMSTTAHKDIDIVSDIDFDVNATSDFTELDLQNTAVNNLDGSMLTLTSQPGDFLCTIANFGPIKSFVVGQLGSQLAGQLSSAISGNVCMKCMDKTDCPAYATDCVSSQCVGSDGKTCLQEVGLDGRMNAGAALAKFSPGLNAYLDVLASLGGYAKADTGLSLGMLGGGAADPHSPCVPMMPAPTPPTITPSPTFTTDVLPDGATPYHVGIGVHVSHLDTLGFGAWDAGALCLAVGTPSEALLSAKTVGVLINSLSDLTHGADAPMYLLMRPSQPPTFVMGKGTFKTDPTTMQRTVDDPLLHITVPKFAIDFYAFIDERYVRIMTLTADLELGVSLDIDATGKLVPILGDLKNAFKNLVVTNSELLSESPDDLAQAFPTLLGVAVGQISGAIPSVSLPAVMGLQITPIAITSTDPDANGTNQYLSIFANISAAPMAEAAADTEATLIDLALPETGAFAVGKRGAIEPAATIAVSGRSVAGAALEWSWSVDDSGHWSPFQTGEVARVTDPQLWLQGRHHVDVRARAAGLPSSLDPTPARVELLVDTIAPIGRFDDQPDGTIVVSASDNVSQAGALRYRFDAGAGFTEWSPATTLKIPGGADPSSLLVQTINEAGNQGSLAFHGRTTNPPASGCGCEIGAAPPIEGAGNSTIVLFLTALGVVLVARRKVFALLLALVAGCNSAPGKGAYENPLDEIGRYSDLVVKDGVFHVSAYDDTTGDLAYARITDLAKPIGWLVVDGVDTTLPPEMAGGYRSGITDPGDDVGLYTSIALTKNGDPRIAYFDQTNSALKFAAGPWPFRTQTVDTGSGGVAVGFYAAISLDANDVPSIAYVATGISDGNGGFKSELRVATAPSPDPAEGSWTTTVADTTRISCAGRCGADSACLQAAMVNGMPNGDPAQSSCTPLDDNGCTAGCTSPAVCINNACTTPLVATKSPDLVDGTGLFAQALRGSNGNLQLVYYDHAQGDLKLATQASAGGPWTVSFIDGNDPSTDVGQFCSAQLAADGTLHVAYVDAIADRLLYKTVSGGTPEAMPEVVDDGMRADGPHSVGAGASLLVNGSNERVVYQDQQLSDLMSATRGGTGWNTAPLSTGPAGYGWWPHLVTDGGKTYLSQFVYDRENASPLPLGSLQISAVP